jgi:hypothetical protein
MGHLPNKAKRLAEVGARADADERQQCGFTVFHFDFKPNLIRRDLTLGEAIRHLLRVTSSRMSFWRCPVRGLAVQIKRLPRTSYSHDHGESFMMLHFCDLEDEVAAKKILVLDMLLTGIDLYRGLPNNVFDEQVATIKWLLTAPPSVPAEEWLKVQGRVHRQTRPLLRTHEAELRHHLLGEKCAGPTGPVALTAQPGLEALERRA